MPSYLDIANTPSVAAAQEAQGSREYNAEAAKHRLFTRFGPDEAAFIAERDSFYLATVSQTGWPYVQHRGGPPGFLKVLDERTLGIADFRGNRQYLTLGNLAASDKASLFLMDYRRQARMKMFVRTHAVDLAADPELAERLATPGYRVHAERALIFRLRSIGIAASTSRRASRSPKLSGRSPACSSASRRWRRRTRRCAAAEPSQRRIVAPRAPPAP
jgi:predicted pyridoxine 5'-phosphate oxidase superfamily flavin-nucleotide-binding protein